MAYIGTEPKDVRSFGRAKFDYTATQGQTAFTGADDDGKTLGFTDGQIEVFVNGILMDDSDFSTSNGNTVTLASAANLNDIISIVAMQTDIPNSDYVPASGGTFSGDVTHSGAVTNSSTTTMTGDLSVTGADVTITGSTNTDATLNVLSPNWVTGAYADINIAHQPTSRKIRGHYDNGIEIFTNNANAALKVDPSGRVTLPYQPAFSTTGTNYTQAGGAYSTVVPATMQLNVGSHYNSSTGVWTVPVAGNYLVTANGLVYPTGTGGSGYVFSTAWYKNGTQWEDFQDGEYYSNHSTICNSAIIPCAANDTLDFRLYRASVSTAAAYGSQFVMYGYLLG